MSDLGNKTIMAQNIQFYLDVNKMSRQDLCNSLKFKYSTLSAWLAAEKYPRIDKIEMMANFFKISKADLVESKDRRNSPSALTEQEQNHLEQYRQLTEENKNAVDDFIDYHLSRQNEQLKKESISG